MSSGSEAPPGGRADPGLSRPEILAVLTDLVTDHLRRLRGPSAPPPGSLAPEAPLDGGDLAVDSMEILSLAGEVNGMFHLHEAGIEDYLLAHRSLGAWADVVASARRAGVRRITFATSGSTGAPRPHVHSRRSLDQEAEALAGLFAGRRRILRAVPAHHIYGFLFTVLLPRKLGVPAVDLRAGGYRLPLGPGDLVVGHPVVWAHLNRSIPRFPAGAEGVTSTAPCPPDLAWSLLDRGLTRLTEVYGATETGGVGYRRRPSDPFRLFPHWRRGAEETSGNILIRTLPDGEQRRVAAPDRLAWEDPVRFRPAGRLDGAVPVGGINVDPGRVAEKIRAHPLVADCAVRSTDAEGVTRLKAFVVPAAGAPDQASLGPILRRWAAERLPAQERPVRFDFGPALPADDRRKPADG